MTEQATDIELTFEQALAQTADLCQKRADTYAFLARLYRSEIDQDYLDSMKAMRFPYRTGNPQVDEGYLKLTHFLSNTWPNTVEELALDFVRTFIGHGIDGFAAAYPYESVYTSAKRLMMSDARDQVLAIYRSEGLNKDESWKEGEDHLSLEFEFMQTLSLRAAEALRIGDEQAAANLLQTQRSFLHDHILHWVPLFTADMRKFAKSELYLGLASLTDGFLATDREFLDAIVSEDE